MDKARILAEIQRTASENDDMPLGEKSFVRETGIPQHAWRGRYWRNWGDALREAGLTPNRKCVAHSDEYIVQSLARLTLKNHRFPTYADARLAKNVDESFPGTEAISKLGSLDERIDLVRRYAQENPGFADLLNLLPEPSESDEEAPILGAASSIKDGFVYLALLKIGPARRYKIGKAVLVERRRDQIAVQLPEDLELIHVIKTDDAYGIEGYWHRRFEEKKTKGEWFNLSREDVMIFRRRKFM